MKFYKWLSPVLYGFQGLVFLWDGGAGLFYLYRHHWEVAFIDLCGAGFVGTVIYFTHRARRRYEATMRQLRLQLEELERRRAMPDSEQLVAETKAQANLELVMKATGAKFHTDGQSVRVPIQNYEYYVQPGHVYKYSYGILVDRTCLHFQNLSAADVPVPEFIASVILLLKHDPSIFDRWKRQDNYYV